MKKDFKRALSKILAGAMLITSSFSSVVSVTAAENDSTGDTVAFQNDLKSITVPSTTTPTSIDGATISLVAQNETESILTKDWYLAKMIKTVQENYRLAQLQLLWIKKLKRAGWLTL